MMFMFTDPNAFEKTDTHFHFFASQHVVLVTDVSELFQCPCPNIKYTLNDTHVCVFIVPVISLYIYKKLFPLVIIFLFNINEQLAKKHLVCIYAHTKDVFAHYNDYRYTVRFASV